MGSWNETCMISNLPIMFGDKIKLVLLKSFVKDELANSGFCYSTGLMMPAFLPISGKYDDYGTIGDIVEDWNYKIISETLKKKYKAVKADGEEIENFELEDVLFGIERGNLEVILNKKNDEEGDFETTNLCYVMIRQDVWDGLCKNYRGEFWNDNKEENDKGEYYISAKEYCKRKFDEMNTSIKEYKELMKQISESNSEEDKGELLSRVIRSLTNNIFSGSRHDGLVHGRHEYEEYTRNFDFDKDDIFRQWSEYITICSFLDSTRKSWMIQAGKGSQSEEWGEYKILSKIIDDICDKNGEEEDC